MNLKSTSISVDAYHRAFMQCIASRNSRLEFNDQRRDYGDAAAQMAALLATLCHINLEIVRELRRANHVPDCANPDAPFDPNLAD